MCQFCIKLPRGITKLLFSEVEPPHSSTSNISQRAQKHLLFVFEILEPEPQPRAGQASAPPLSYILSSNTCSFCFVLFFNMILMGLGVVAHCGYLMMLNSPRICVSSLCISSLEKCLFQSCAYFSLSWNDLYLYLFCCYNKKHRVGHYNNTGFILLMVLEAWKSENQHQICG